MGFSYLFFYFSAIQQFLSDPISFNLSTHTMNFTFLNGEGDPVRECYITLHSFPRTRSDGAGVAEYNFRGDKYEVKFNYNRETDTLDAWCSHAPENRFTMTPVEDENEF